MAIITRKIQVYVSEEDKELKKQFIHSVYEWRDITRQCANFIATHMFIQQNVRDFVYLRDEIAEKFYVQDCIKEGKGMSERNITYKMCSDIAKGLMNSAIYSNLNQQVRGQVKAEMNDVRKGKRSLRSYRNNIGIPFDKRSINFEERDGKFCFRFYGVPMCCRLGADLSNNEIIIRRCMDGEYNISTSSLMIDDDRKRFYLMLVVDIPQNKHDLTEGKTLYAKLDMLNPIVCTADPLAKDDFSVAKKKSYIGTKDEFLHQRIAIQAALQRCQAAAKYSRGGHGRKRKLQSIERWHKKEYNYINTKLHKYSRELVNIAIKNKCSIIVLLDQKEKEAEAKQNELILRNWSYYGLKDKIEYKGKMNGIEIIIT